MNIINSAIEKFVDDIHAITDSDYGDFMRKANSRFLELKKEIIVFINSPIEETLTKMQRYLQYNPNWDIQCTKQKLLNDARRIDELMAAEKQDWESWAP